ncbi:3'-5' exonuclease [Serratia proteamaculans]|uniref:3'-5' exonuclease n=1 Tax=Serratia proteamaculans TaxID=28151 RepID=UPI001021EB84|nr:3'-5' exonuclease [Serratia proteamaculans]RYM51260.1 exodeoxyribonuclease VIII [Serratia proteamaculans]
MVNTITIDTETLDTTPSAVILSIGAFAFDIDDVRQTQKNIIDVARYTGDEYTGNAFYFLADTFDQLMKGRTVSAKTQDWWRKQGEEAQEALVGGREPLRKCLELLSYWIKDHPDARIFFRGTDFDGSILENAYRMYAIECPWHWGGKRDVRTYIDAMTKGTKGYLPKTHQPCFAMVKHNSLHDAMNDAEQMVIAYQLNSQQITSCLQEGK